MSLNVELSDRVAVIDLLTEYVACLDERRFEAVSALFAENGRVVFPGGEIGGADLPPRAASDLELYVRTQHVVSNQRVTLFGERAKLHAEAIGTHVIEPGVPSRIAVVGGAYDCELSKIDGQWLFEAITPAYLWFAGEPLLH